MLRTSIVLAFAISAPLAAQSIGQPWDSAGKIIGVAPAATSGYYRYNLPRRDITLKVGDVIVAPQLALGTYVGIVGTATDATMMGDLVVLPAELKNVTAELSRRHVSITAIHNHIVGSEPSLVYVHYHAVGAVLDLASRISTVLAKTGVPRPVAAAGPASALTIDTAEVFAALGHNGRAQGSVVQYGFQFVPGALSMMGHELNPSLAYGSPINVQQVSPTRDIATGDFAIVEAKVQPLLDVLAAHGITATAMHTHLMGETPKVYYIHFWADGAPVDVLAGLKAAVGAAK